MFNLKQYNWRRLNITLILMVIVLCIMSAYFVKCAGNVNDLGDEYFKRQIVGLIIGLVIVVVVALLDYHFVCEFVVIYYIIGVVLAAATRFSPIGTDLSTGSYRWIKLPGLNFQPSEICKIILILSLAVFLNKYQEQLDKFRIFLLGILVMAVPTCFILVQSDLSSSCVMIFIFFIMIFAAGLSYKIVFSLLVIGIPSILGLFWYIQQPNQKLPLKSYQIERIIGFLEPEKYASTTMYQQIHSVQAIASGKLYGKMIADNPTVVRDYNWVDVIESDFIFTVIGEEVGFIGSCIVIGLLFAVVIKCMATAKRAKDFLGRMIAIGVSAMFIFQVFANIGVATSILPNTGLPLPFLSNGLSSMIGGMIGIGLVLNIGLQTGNANQGSFNFDDL